MNGKCWPAMWSQGRVLCRESIADDIGSGLGPWPACRVAGCYQGVAGVAAGEVACRDDECGATRAAIQRDATAELVLRRCVNRGSGALAA